MKTKCPWCGDIATRHETLDGTDDDPDEDCTSVCMNCGEPSVFYWEDGYTLKLRKAKEEEIDGETQKVMSLWTRTKPLWDARKKAAGGEE